jgi:YYY domain-containing protein
LSWRFFGRLPDRGYGLTKALGLLAGGYILWIGASFGFLRNSPTGALGSVIVLGVVSLSTISKQRTEFKRWIRENLKVIFAVEGLFIFAFVLWAFVRANNPEIQHTEKPMELAFLNSILKSDTFPPKDPWLSGYAISYYYFGYILLALMGHLTSTIAGEVFNLGNALWFALTALGAYSILFNLLAAESKKPRIFAPLLAPLFVLIIGNYEAILELLYHKHIFWEQLADGEMVSSFWSWLNLDDLAKAPTGVSSWAPKRFLWWWQASRVIQDVNLAGQSIEVIDEFPFFSFLLGDNHPHLLALPFVLTAVSTSLNLFLGELRTGDDSRPNVMGIPMVLGFAEMLPIAWLFGSLAFLNTWDLPIYLSLLFASVIWKLRRRTIRKIVKLILPSALIILVAAVLFYLPWYPGFSSQAGGILPNVLFPTRLPYFLIMFAPLCIPIFFWMGVGFREHIKEHGYKTAVTIALGTPLVLLVISSLLALIIYLVIADNGNFLGTVLSGLGIQGENAGDALKTLVSSALSRRLTNSWTALFLGLMLAMSVGPLVASRMQGDGESKPKAQVFIMIMIAIGALLVIGPEFLYVRDSFGTRMNTVFKFYFAAWILWGIVAGYAVLKLLPKKLEIREVLKILVVLPILFGLLYPILALWTKTNQFNPVSGRTLDGTAYIARNNPAEYEAIEWLNRNIEDGVIAEAVGGSYSEFARISTHTGLTTVLGWPGHELQWRGGYEIQGSREGDVATLYTTSSTQEAQEIVNRYAIDYIYIGSLENRKYRPPNYAPLTERKFYNFMDLVYESNDILIFKTRDELR